MDSKKEVAFLCTHTYTKKAWLFSGQFCNFPLLGTSDQMTESGTDFSCTR